MIIMIKKFLLRPFDVKNSHFQSTADPEPVAIPRYNACGATRDERGRDIEPYFAGAKCIEGWRLLRYFCFFFSILLTQLLAAYNPLLVAVCMIKNEAPVIRDTLKPMVDGGIDAFFIFDTGSTDDTIAVTKAFFKEQGITDAVIVQEPFINFAVSRNHALDYAEKAFPDACFMLMPDAEWHLYNVPGLLEYCAQHQDDPSPSHLVRIVMNDTLDFCTPRLIRCRSGVRFVGAVHEVLNAISRQKVPEDVFFELHTTPYGSEKTRKRWLRDVDLLTKEYEENPENPRTVFYLAQTYACLGNWEKAREWYEKRSTMVGWDEENFMARYRLAQAYENLGTWDKACTNYLAAYAARPTRAEPLVALASYYWNTQSYPLCFLFARRATELAYPAADLLFVEKQVYDCTRYDLLGRCAWYVGEYEIGEAAVRAALIACPDAPHLLRNLAFYTERTKGACDYST